jgi:hypothetical protein
VWEDRVVYIDLPNLGSGVQKMKSAEFKLTLLWHALVFVTLKLHILFCQMTK